MAGIVQDLGPYDVYTHQHELKKLISEVTTTKGLPYISEDDLSYLLNERQFFSLRVNSSSAERIGRIQAVIKVVQEYKLYDIRKFTSCVAHIITSPNTPIMMGEVNQLKELMSLLHPEVKFIWSACQNKTITGDTTQLLLVLSRN